MASSDFDFNSPISKDINGWYFRCDNGYLYSGPPYYLEREETKLQKNKDEIIVVMDMNKGTLKFIIDNEDKGNSFSNIPTDKPLFPSVLLSKIGDSIEITSC